jgi:hypothetical protein
VNRDLSQMGMVVVMVGRHVKDESLFGLRVACIIVPTGILSHTSLKFRRKGGESACIERVSE